VSEKKKCRNASNKRKQRFRENNPGSEARQKEKERHKDALLRFHIKRNFLYGYGYPESLDRESDAFKRVRAEYMAELSRPVEIIEGDCA